MIEAALVAVIIALLVAAWGVYKSTKPDATADWQPHELMTAELMHIEQDLAGTLSTGHHLYGRPDRVYKTKSGQHIPVEYKTRMRQTVYPSDVAQLSLQAWLLGKNGYKPAQHGYVVVDTPKGREAHPVRLLGPEKSESLVARYLDILDGKTTPRATPGRKCESCGHASRCRADRGMRNGR